VRFTAPQATGTADGAGHSYSVAAGGPQHTHGCLDSVRAQPVVKRAGEAMAVRLRAGAQPGHWCPGSYHGTVSEVIRPVCAAGTACPQYVVLRPLGSFSFRVVR
jgi:hypothetical protein